MYNSWEAHYRQVTVLRFTPDGEALLSGSDDSGITVWSVFRFARVVITLYTRMFLKSYSFGRLLDDSVRDEIPEAYADLSDHTLPITDIACGLGPFPSCRVLTASTDHSVKVCCKFLRCHIPQLIAPKVMGPRVKVAPIYFPVSSRCHLHCLGRC
jgi:pre-rRNA-processing protein IPI3